MYLFTLSTSIGVFNCFSIPKHDLFNCVVSQFLDFLFSNTCVLNPKSAMC